MSDVHRAAYGHFKLSRRGLFKQSQRLKGEQMKEKEKKCWTCGSMPWRVQGKRCKECELEYSPEEVCIEIASLKSVAGNFEDNF